MTLGAIDLQSPTLEKPMFDLPPDSFWVPKDDEQDWVDRNAMMQRKTSIKLGFAASSTQNAVSFSQGYPLSFNQNHRPSSIIGLSASTRSPHLGIAGDAGRPANQAWLLRSRSEPGSPRVSCTGRVVSNKCNHKKTGFMRLFSSIFRTARSVTGEIGGGSDKRLDQPVRSN